MKVFSRSASFAILLLIVAASLCFGRTILDRKMYYLNSVTNKTGETKFWFVYLGQHDCTLNRKYPGEETQPVTCAINLSLLSSGYIEGSGYSAKGKIDCTPTMQIKNARGERPIVIDSIDCIFDFGQKVRMVDGDVGELIIDVEGLKETASRFVLTEYTTIATADGERELKKTADDIPVAAIAFSKEGIARAIKGIPYPPKTDTVSLPAK